MSDFQPLGPRPEDIGQRINDAREFNRPEEISRMRALLRALVAIGKIPAKLGSDLYFGLIRTPDREDKK